MKIRRNGKLNYLRGGAVPNVIPPEPSPFTWGTALSTESSTFSSSANGVRSFPSVASELAYPYPTNSFWKNLLVGGSKVDIKPYISDFLSTGIGICFPSSRSSSASGVTEGYAKNISVECTETPGVSKIQSYDDLTMTYRWEVDSTHKMVAPIVRGTVMFTMLYTALTPKFSTAHAITSVNGESIPGTHTGTKFKVVMNNGQTWIIYSSSLISLTSATSSLTATGTFTGTIQVALLKSAGYETTLDNHAGNYPTACSINHVVSGDTDTETWTWTKVGGNFLWHPLMIHMALSVSPTLTGIKMKRLWMDDSCEAFSVGTTQTFQQTLPTIQEGYPNFDAGKVSAIQTAFNTDKTYNPGVSNDPYFGGKALNKLAELGFISAHSQIADSTSRASIISTLKTSVVAWLDATNTNKIKYDSTWGGLCTTNGLADQNADFGNGIYNDHHFHWGYHIRACAFLAKYDATFLASYGSKVENLIRDIMNPSTSDSYFTRFRNHDFYHMHCWADGLTDFGDVHNQESISESVFAWYAVALYGQVTNDENIKEHARILLAKEIACGNLYWHHKSADTSLETVYEDNRITGIPWETKMDFATWFGAYPEYIYGIQMIPASPIASQITPSDWMTEAWPVIESRVFTRDYPVSLSITNSGSGYSGSSSSYTGHTVANGVTTSGGTGTGLTVNLNIRNSDGGINEAFIVNRGSGYVQGDTVSLVNSTGGLSAGGSGAVIRLNISPSDSWAGILHAGHAAIDKEEAWTDTNALSSWDDGTTKTNQLAYIASVGN